MASDAPPLARAKALALRALASRMRTEAQLRSRLEKAELGACADEVVAWLRRLGYLDDDAYARARARALVAPGRLGPRLAERRLRGEGVGAAQARAAIARALEDADAAGEGGEPAPVARFLLGRGFAGPVVARVLGIYEDT